jgi:hypothetical protein
MYHPIRQLHLWSAFLIAIFLVMYFVTGYVLTRSQWFGSPEPTQTTRWLELDSPSRPGNPEQRTFTAWLKQELRLSGKPELGRRRRDGSWEFRFHRPGYLATVSLSADLKTAKITESRYRWQQIFIGFHRLHGYGGGWLYDLWAVLYDAVSAAMIVFALSGVWLWYRLAKNKIPGGIILGAGFSFSLATILFLLLAP